MSTAADLFEVIDATWPAARLHEVGGFVLREGAGGGKRVSAASLRDAAAFDTADLPRVEAAHRALGQPPLFMIRAGDDRLDAELEACGYVIVDPVTIYEGPLASFTATPIPPITAFDIWPPLAIMDEIWLDGHIGPARRAVMDRADCAKTGLLGRIDDRAAGVGYVGLHAGVAMIHALHVLPEWRRRGLAGYMLQQAGFWAEAQGARAMTLVVTCANLGAIKLYESFGMQKMGQYHYRLHPDHVA